MSTEPPRTLPERMADALSGLLPDPVDGRVLMSPDEQASARPAAVLCALVAASEGPGVLLTRRTEHLPHHAGQISFAGGRVAPGDAGPVATALREAREEIGLDPGLVQVLGQLPEFLVPSGFRVTPVLAWVDQLPVLRADPAEVSEIFLLPGRLALDPEAWHIEEVERNGRRHPVWVMDFEGRRIWGATAAILVWLARWLRGRGVVP